MIQGLCTTCQVFQRGKSTFFKHPSPYCTELNLDPWITIPTQRLTTPPRRSVVCTWVLVASVNPYHTPYLEKCISCYKVSTLLHNCMPPITKRVYLNNPRCACAARVMVVCWPNSCVSVCLSVCLHARFYAKKGIRTALVQALFGYKFVDFQKNFRSKVMA